MLFSKLVEALKDGESCVDNYFISNDPEIISAASLEKASSKEISFVESGSYLLEEFQFTKASAVILPSKNNLIEKLPSKEISWITVESPRIAFAEILELFQSKSNNKLGIHKTAVIERNVQIGKNISIGANVYIGEDSKIGDNTTIKPGVFIDHNVEIGKNNQLQANCVIHAETKTGDHCVINSNAVLGSEGFGFIPTKTGWRKMPQTGKVILEDHVEIGSCSTIDRPAVGDTLIKTGTKIDNLIQIGHGVQVGKHCAFAAQVGIAGGAKVGDNVILAGQVGVGNRVKIGDNVIASSKCGIHTDIDPGEVVSGFPAIPNKLWLRCSASFKKLPEIAKAIRKLNHSD